MTENENSPENLRKFLESDDPAMVQMGLSMAKGSGVPDEMLGEILWMYMMHDDKTIRSAAKSTFMKIAPEDAKQLVKENWKASYRTHQPRRKLSILGKTLFHTSVNLMRPLIKALGDGEYEVRKNAANVLGEIGDKRAMEPLIRALREKNSTLLDVHKSYFAASVAEALGDIGDKRAVEPLIKTLRDDKIFHHHPVCHAAAEALEKIGKPAIEPLIEALRDENHYVRKNVAQALGKLGWKPETEGQRAAYLIADENWELLVEMGDLAVEPLIEALKCASNSKVGLEVAKVLGKIGDPRAVEPLIEALEDSSCIENAAEALGKIGDARAVEPLIKAFKTLSDFTGPEYQKSRSIKEALGKIGDTRAIEPLITYLCNKGWKNGVPTTHWLYNRGAGRTFQSVMKEFGELAVEPLITLLDLQKKNKYYGMKSLSEHIIQVLGEIGDARAVEPLIALLEDDKSTKEILPQYQLLAEGLPVPTNYLNNAAKEALKKLGHEVE